MKILLSVVIFLVSAIFEIGGLYFIWYWRRENEPPSYLLYGIGCLIIYGVVSTYQPQVLAKSYSTYGGIFIAFSFLGGVFVEKYEMNTFDKVGSAIVLLGVIVIYFSEEIKMLTR